MMSTQINGTSGVIFPDSSNQNTAATGFGFKNRLINGAMMIDQRNAGASVTPTTSGSYTLDRWQAQLTQSSKYSVQQVASSLSGFSSSLKVTSLSAYSIVSSDYFAIGQGIEGNNISDLAWGTASASPITLSFKVYSSLTGTFGGSVQNRTGDTSYPFSYSIPVANTWTPISITISGPTTGTWNTNNTTGIWLWFGLGAGSTWSGTAGSWSSANYISATGATSVVGTNGATFYITGVQLEKGSTATSFDYRPYGTELALCQRYYEQGTGINNPTLYATTGVALRYACWWYKVTKRTSPTPAFANQSYSNCSGLTAQTLTPDYFQVYVTATAAGTYNCGYDFTASAEL